MSNSDIRKLIESPMETVPGILDEQAERRRSRIIRLADRKEAKG